MIFSAKDRDLEVDEDGVKIYDYKLDNKLGISYQELSGRTPVSGQGKNTVCDEWYFVISGHATVSIDGKESQVAEGDVIYIPQNSTSYLVGDNLKIITITRPDWYQEQYEEV